MENASLKAFIQETNAITPRLYFDAGSDTYALPDTEWIEQVFTPYYRKFIFKNNLTFYEENANDCSQYTLYALTCANLLFYNHAHPKETSLAVGTFSYVKGFKRHVIVAFVARDNNTTKLLFYEPQQMQLIDLEQPERWMCLEIMF